MQTSRWNRAEKIEFYREYFGVVFPVLEGEHDREDLIFGCSRFLKRYAGVEVAEKADIAAPVTHLAGPGDRFLLSRFLLEALMEKLREAREEG